MRKAIAGSAVAASVCLVLWWFLAAPFTLPLEVISGHARLRADSAAIEGEFFLYQTEAIVPEAVNKSPEELGLPLQSSGYFWRKPGAFRLDFADGSAIAAGDDLLCEFQPGEADEQPTLTLYDRKDPRAQFAESFYTGWLEWEPNVLWANSGGRMSFVELSETEQTRLTATPGGGIRLQVIHPTIAGKAEFELAPDDPHPITRMTIEGGDENRSLKIERHFVSTKVDGHTLPAKIVERVAQEGSTVTKVLVFRLKPLSENSPIADPISPKTFDDLNASYSVIDAREDRRGLFD
ncbi:hypothetical protein GYB59_25210 [bacterium]|nr:hypothetical protein [bacterium]